MEQKLELELEMTFREKIYFVFWGKKISSREKQLYDGARMNISSDVQI